MDWTGIAAVDGKIDRVGLHGIVMSKGDTFRLRTPDGEETYRVTKVAPDGDGFTYYYDVEPV